MYIFRQSLIRLLVRPRAVFTYLLVEFSFVTLESLVLIKLFDPDLVSFKSLFFRQYIFFIFSSCIARLVWYFFGFFIPKYPYVFCFLVVFFLLFLTLSLVAAISLPFHYYYYYKFFTPALADGLLLECERLQVSPGPQNSSHYSGRLLYIDLRAGQTCHSKVMHRKEETHSDGSYEKKLRRRAWLKKWDKVKIPWYTHRLMHRKRVTCELHDSFVPLMTIKHAIPKIEWAII